MVLSLKPSEDGKALIVTLFNSSDENEKTTLKWQSPVKATYYSNTSEMPLQLVNDKIDVPAWEVVTIRSEK